MIGEPMLYHNEEEAHRESNAAIAFLWAADSIGALVLIAFFIAVFFVLGVMNDKTDANRPAVKLITSGQHSATAAEN